MLHLHLSNRPEALAAALAATMRTDPLPLLDAESVVAPSTAAARWLGFRLADALGIAVRTEFPFAAAYVWRLFGQLLPEVGAENPFGRPAMQWRLLRLLAASAAPEVKRYLAGDDGTRACELAGRLAALFERYLVERSDWLADWRAGKTRGLGPDERWQAGLWRTLAGELDAAEAHPRERFLARLRDDPAARRLLPRRLALWCVEAMPELYWQTFAALAEWIDVHAFVLAPSREYWGDIVRRRTQLRVALDHPGQEDLLDVGHPLLASLGRARRHAFARLALAEGVEHAYWSEPPATLLGALQRDLLDLKQSAGVAPDASLQLHDCHGAQREAEVLHDRLLELFERLPNLAPADILILTPDIDTYAPAVEAVLAHAPLARRIPCAVADRPAAELPLWRALRRLCAAAAGELDAESVMGLLDEPPLARAFGIDAADLPLLRDWVAASGIRWGEDARDRRRRGLPAEEAHSWRAGLRRLLYGVALPDAPERIVDGVLPAAGVEGARAALLGRFIDFAEAVFDLAAKVGAGGTAIEWTALLTKTLERCFAPDETEEAQAQRLREALAAVARLAREAACRERFPLAALLREVDAQLAGRASARAFGGGAAVIAALEPGRPLPARVVCLVGMNDGAWPRPAAAAGFDLIARHPRAGDRERRGDERYAFLEAILCAGEALVVTFTGRDARSNVAQPPAAPLAELLDTLAAMTGENADVLVARHPLQPSGAAAFDGADARLASHAAEYCPPPVARVAAPFAGAEVAADAADAVDVDSLQRFFAHPQRAFLRDRLGIHLESGEDRLETHEPFVPDGLEAYRLREAVSDGWRAGRDEAETTRLLAARGWLPHGVAGALAGQAAHEAMRPLHVAARPWLAAPRLPPCLVDFAADGLRLAGRLDGVTTQGLWRVRPGRLRGKDRLRLWIDHLLLQLAASAEAERVSVLIALDDTLRLAPLARDAAAAHLADLLALWRAGRRAPLPFYPETAWAWSADDNWQRAWAGDAFRDIPGERDDAYVRLALRDSADDPLGAPFQALAARVCAPLLAALERGA
jgi:exodeoxyribonuclease V gamma subunit